MASSNSNKRRPLTQRIIQNFHLVWLDGNINENDDDCRNSINELKQVVNTVNTFVDVDECIDFINRITEETAFMIISGALAQTAVSAIGNKEQVGEIYIFGEHKAPYEEWPKVKGVFTDIQPICEVLKQAAQDCDQNTVLISFAPTGDAATNIANKNTLDCSFMYTQILKDILLTINFDDGHINEFLNYCRIEFADSSTKLRIVNQIEKEYRDHQPIWWYTRETFLYSMLNRALRLMDVDIIIQMGFFVCDLHKNIADLHSKQFHGQTSSQSFIVYRGQGLSQTDFNQLKQNEDGLLAFNNFLSTSKNRNTSLRFLNRTSRNTELVSILFIMRINPSIQSTPFANVATISAISREDEILFSMHSVFRIGNIKRFPDNNQIWEAELTLTADNDPQLCELSETIQQETSNSEGWSRLGKLLIKLAKFDKAEALYAILLKPTTDQTEKANIFHQFGSINDHRGEHSKALEYYEKSLEIRKQSLPANHPSLGGSYNNIGLVYNDMGEYSKAIEYYEKSLEIMKQSLPANHPSLGGSYNNIGLVYNDMGEYSKALEHYEKSLEIRKQTLPANHPDLATSYSNMGNVYNYMGEYSKAIEYYEKSLEIMKQSLPANHPDLATSYNNMGTVYNDIGEYSKALEYYEKSVEIRKQSLPANHPDLATSYNNMGTVYNYMGEYSKALEHYEKSHEIMKQSLPANHPSLATSYSNMGTVYNDIGEYSKALEHYEKSHEIRKQTFPENQPDLAMSYNNMGTVYHTMGEYSKAIEYYEKSVEIMKQSLPANHPDLATSYNNIGLVYNDMGEYSKALEYYEKSLEIRKQTLPANHPSLATSYNNIGWVYRNKTDYKKALDYYERSLDILQRLLPSNHSNIQTVKQSIDFVKTKL